MSSQDRYSRRRFLSALGIAPALLPLLETERQAQAGCLSTGPKRLVVITWTNGVLGWAKGNEANFTLADFMMPLEPLRNDLLLIDRVKYQNLADTPNPDNADSVGHGAVPAMLTGSQYVKLIGGSPPIAGSASVDQYVASALAKKGYSGLPGLTLGVQSGNNSRAFWKSAYQAVSPDDDPYHVFDTLFAGRAGGLELDRLRKVRKSVLDQVGRDLTRFGKTVGTDDRQHIQAHLDSVREIERQLTPLTLPPGCQIPTPVGDRIKLDAIESFPVVMKLQMDLAITALAADATRVVSIQTGHESNNHVVPVWLGFALTGKPTGLGDENSHHSIAHAGGDRKRKVDEWFFQQFAYFIGRLAAEKEGAKRMLDSTAVLVINNMGNGGAHNVSGVPWFIAGSCGGYFKTGRALTTNNPAQNGILIALANAMGVPTETFGSAKYGGELAALRG